MFWRYFFYIFLVDKTLNIFCHVVSHYYIVLQWRKHNKCSCALFSWKLTVQYLFLVFTTFTVALLVSCTGILRIYSVRLYIFKPSAARLIFISWFSLELKSAEIELFCVDFKFFFKVLSQYGRYRPVRSESRTELAPCCTRVGIRIILSWCRNPADIC